jgi:hypothetical protein
VYLVVRKIGIDLTRTSYFASQTIKGRLELDGHTIDRLVEKRFVAFDDIAGNGARDHCSINFLSCTISSSFAPDCVSEGLCSSDFLSACFFAGVLFCG